VPPDLPEERRIDGFYAVPIRPFPGAALPCIGGRPYPPAGGTAEPLGKSERLPMLVPASADPGLRLTVSGEVMTIQSDRDLWETMPEFLFVGRWWVNGKPFVPAKLEEFEVHIPTLGPIRGRTAKGLLALDRKMFGATRSPCNSWSAWGRGPGFGMVMR